MNQPADFEIDRRAVRRNFSRHAATVDSVSVLSREVSSRMAERLDYIRIEPRRIIDAGCGTGMDLAELARRYPTAEIFGIDAALPAILRARPARGLLARINPFARANGALLACADVERLPLASGTASMVWSNLMFNWLDDPLPGLKELGRVLEVGGMVMFSTLGPDTLKELRSSFPETEQNRVHRFIDMHDIGDVLVKAGFGDPVMDMQMITLTYADLDDLLRDLRLGGTTSAARNRSKGLTGRGIWREVRQRYEAMRCEGRLPATFEVVFGHAWKIPPKTTADGRSVIQFRPRDDKQGKLS